VLSKDNIMGQRLAVIGFVIAVILAIYMFTQQQQAQTDLQTAQTAQADMADRSGTAVAQAQGASTAQSQADDARITAVAQAENAAATQAESDSRAATAAADARIAGTRSAEIAAAGTAQDGTIQAVQATAEYGVNQQATLEAQSTAALSTAQAQIDAQATVQTGYDSAVGTATAQVDLAEFARQAAEEDRATALAQFWVAATVIADQSDTQGTAQAIVSGVTGTPLPAATPVPPTPVESTTLPQPTTSAGTIPPLTESYTTNDKKLTFNYPQGWVAGEVNQGVILIANSQTILQRSSNDLQSGEVEIQMIVGPASSIRGVTAGAKPSEVLDAVRTIYQSQNVTNLSDNNALTLGEHAAARLTAIEGNNAVAITVVDLGNDNIALAFAYAFPGELDLYLKGIDAVLATLQYQG
jgi:hypothetical protein